MKITKMTTMMLAGGLVCLQSVFAQSHMQAAVVDQADLLVAGQPEHFSQSAFAKAMEENQPEELKEMNKAQWERITEATGLEDGDVTAVVMSARLADLNIMEMENTDFEALQVVAAFQLKRAVTLQQIQALIDIMQEDAFSKLRMQEGELDGRAVLEILAPEGETDGPQKMFAALADEGKTVVLALNEATMRGALQRVSEGRAGRPNAEMAQALQALRGQQMQMALILPENMRQALQMAMQGGDMGPMGMMVMPFMGTKSILMGANAAENLNVKLMMDLGDADSAQMMSNMAPGMMGGMAGMFPAAQKIRFGAQGSVLEISAELTPEDLQPDPEAMMMMQGF